MHSKPDLKTGIRKRKGKTAILNITSHCNASCIFCSEGDHSCPVNVSFDVIQKTIARFKRQGVQEVNFMGGETTVRDDLEDILKYLKEKRVSSYLVTNAIKFSDQRFAERILKYLTSIEISLHACNKSMFKKIMGVDAFDQVVEGIKNIKKYNRCVAVFFNFVPNSINYNKILKVIKLIKGLMGKERFLVHVKTLNIEGKVEENLSLVPDYNKFSPYLREALSYASKNDIAMVVSRFPLCIYSGYEHFCLELPLELRTNEIFLNNSCILKKGVKFKSQKILKPSNECKIDVCDRCSLLRICPQVDLRHLRVKKENFFRAKRRKIKTVIKKMIEESYFFKMDYFYHEYPFECDFKDKRKIKLISENIESLLLSSK